MLNFGIFGVPMVGSGICGFDPQPTEELCNRWIELGAFYPFSRDHANFYSPRQELYVWDTVGESPHNALGMRYKLLPYLYSLSFEAHTTGAPIARKLYGLLRVEHTLRALHWSDGVTGSRAGSHEAWYSMFDMTQVIVSKGGKYVTLDAPLHVINVHLYPNNIIPMQQGGMTSKEARITPYHLVVTFPAGASHGQAKENFFVDEDELPEMKLGGGSSTYVDFYATVEENMVKVWSQVQKGKFASDKGWSIGQISVLGLGGTAGTVAIEVDNKVTPRLWSSVTVKILI